MQALGLALLLSFSTLYRGHRYEAPAPADPPMGHACLCAKEVELRTSGTPPRGSDKPTTTHTFTHLLSPLLFSSFPLSALPTPSLRWGLPFSCPSPFSQGPLGRAVGLACSPENI